MTCLLHTTTTVHVRLTASLTTLLPPLSLIARCGFLPRSVVDSKLSDDLQSRRSIRNILAVGAYARARDCCCCCCCCPSVSVAERCAMASSYSQSQSQCAGPAVRACVMNEVASSSSSSFFARLPGDSALPHVRLVALTITINLYISVPIVVCLLSRWHGLRTIDQAVCCSTSRWTFCACHTTPG